MGPEIRVFAIFSSLHASLVFLDIALDCSFGQCLTSSRAETPPPKKKKKKKLWPKLGPNNLVYTNVVKCPLKLACYFLILFTYV